MYCYECKYLITKDDYDEDEKRVVSNQYCAYFYDRFIAKWNVNLKSPDIYNPYWCNFGEEGEEEYVPAVSDGCFSKDTLISTKKGQKKITDLSNDEILVFDHENGILAYTNTYFVNVINDKTFNMIKLYFDDDSSFEILDHHGFYDIFMNKYVQIGKENVNNYIDHLFAKVENNNIVSVRLVKYEFKTVVETAYSIVSGYYFNHIANNLLCVTDGLEGMYNYFTYDENLKIISSLKENDIKKYGLSSYDDWAALASKEEYELFNMKYANIAVGKGLCIIDDFIYYIRHFLHKEI